MSALDAHDSPVRKSVLLLAASTVAAGALLAWSLRAFGAQSMAFAFVVVWLPMTWLGVASRWIHLRLPDAYHALRQFELDGRLYERLGVRLAKRLLRRGPLAMFNPGLHLPIERTPEQLVQLERRMRAAEVSHVILLVATLPIVGHAVARGWWIAAGFTLLFDVLINGYPVMLQRYNRALLRLRFGVGERQAPRPSG